MFYLCLSTMTDMIHFDPTLYPILQARGLPDAFIAALRSGVPTHVDAVTAIPAAIEALCLTEAGRELVKKKQPMRCLIPILTSKAYCASVVQSEFGPRLEELIRHLNPDMRPLCVDAMLAVLRVLCAVGGDSAALGWAAGDAPNAVVAIPPKRRITPQRLPHTPEAAGGVGVVEGAVVATASELSSSVDEVESAVSYSAEEQDGCLPGIGPGGVVMEWSHLQTDTEKLEV